jgi:hypothetical protein
MPELRSTRVEQNRYAESSHGWMQLSLMDETDPTTFQTERLSSGLAHVRIADKVLIAALVYNVFQEKSAVGTKFSTTVSLGWPTSRSHPALPFFKFSNTIHQLQALRTRPLQQEEDRERLQVAIREALIFVTKLPQMVPEPSVSASDEGEVVLEWYVGKNEAVAGFEGDGGFGYTLLEGGQFIPGQQEGVLDGRPPPSDLISYLMRPAK